MCPGGLGGAEGGLLSVGERAAGGALAHRPRPGLILHSGVHAGSSC